MVYEVSDTIRYNYLQLSFSNSLPKVIRGNQALSRANTVAWCADTSTASQRFSLPVDLPVASDLEGAT